MAVMKCNFFVIVFYLILIFPIFVFASSSPLVLVTSDSFITDLRYNTDDNFLKKNVYRDFKITECSIHTDLFDVLKKLVPLLQEKKLKLVFWDCWRPLEVQRAMWKIVPDSRYVANPKNGSHHNRGVAVDVTLAGEDGMQLSMTTLFDDFTPKASPAYQCLPEEKEKCQNRDLLIQFMAQVGLKPLATEWWHYQLADAKKYPLIEKNE